MAARKREQEKGSKNRQLVSTVLAFYEQLAPFAEAFIKGQQDRLTQISKDAHRQLDFHPERPLAGLVIT